MHFVVSVNVLCWLLCRYLDLSNDGLTGSIPSGLGSLSSLAVLHLQSNQFSGE